MKAKASTLIILLFVLSSPLSARHSEPKLSISHSTISGSVRCGGSLDGRFSWDIYSGDNQPGNPVWVIVYGVRDSSGKWVGGEPVVAYRGIPGTYPGKSGAEFVRIGAPETPGTYTLWAHAHPSTRVSDAIGWFRRTTTTRETNIHQRIAVISVSGPSVSGSSGSSGGKRRVRYSVYPEPKKLKRGDVGYSSYAEDKRRETRIIVNIFVLGPIVLGALIALVFLWNFFFGKGRPPEH